jgi:tetratricopeptide (TPR) repeat protein
LANAQSISGDNNLALRTLQDALAVHPGDASIETLLADVLRRENRDKDSAAMAKMAISGSHSAGILNDNAYLLSEVNLDLPLAETTSRRSIEMLESDSAKLTADTANRVNFSQSDLLVASWDTLGWIYFKEGKLDAAKPWLIAAWRASLRAEIGDHLGQLYEAMGQKDEAATAYALAQTALDKNVPSDVRNHITEGIQRLKAAGAKPGPAGTSALQDLRTYKVPKPSGVSGWGAYRLVITNAGVTESQQMSGEQKIAGMKTALEGMKFPGLVPPDSKAHLLRSAVVSCSMGTTCEVVLVPDGGLQTERQ